jgi:hypothetical protein
MSTTELIASISVYQGAQGKFYEFDGRKYHPSFPIGWAMNHRKFQDGEYEIGTGPKECGNCNAYGSIRSVFVGYWSNCLEHYTHLDDDYRGNNYAPGLPAHCLEDEALWMQYPYMYGVKKSEIGDEEGADLTDEGINLERLAEDLAALQGDEDDERNPMSISEIEIENELLDQDEDDDDSVDSIEYLIR